MLRVAQALHFSSTRVPHALSSLAARRAFRFSGTRSLFLQITDSRKCSARRVMTVKKMLIGSLALLVIALMMAPSLMAQSLVSGDLTGTVTDPSGAVVSGASVSLKSDATGQTRNATTNGSGAYRFSLLSPGSYTITASASGFSKAQTVATIT